MTLFDIHLLPVLRIQGERKKEAAGIYYSVSPSRCARSRKGDRIILYLALSGNLHIAPEETRQILSTAAQVFYQTSGSVTGAMRETLEEINDALTSHSLSASGQGKYLIGRLVIAVARAEMLYLLISGPVTVITLDAQGTEIIPEDTRAGKGLGFSQSAPYYLSRLPLHSPQKIALCAYTPKDWETFFQHEKVSTPVNVIGDTLLEINPSDVHALLLDIRAGEGALRLYDETLAKAPAPSAEADVRPQPPVAETVPPQDSLPQPAQAEPPEAPPESTPDSSTHWVDGQAAARPRPRISPPKINLPAEKRRQLAETLLDKLHQFRARKQSVQKTSREFLPRLLPVSAEKEPPSPPAWLLILIAVLVPVIVAITASSIYTRQGLQAQATTYYQQALVVYEQARAETNPALQREDWLQALSLLDQADQIYPLDESTGLRQSIQAQLDILENVLRLDFQPVRFTLPENAHITHMTATQGTLFMLDEGNQRIWRAIQTNSGWKLDPHFQCAAGNYPLGDQNVTVGAPVDMVIADNLPADIVAVDNQGHLLLCQADAAPQVQALTQPELGLKEVTAIDLVNGYFYLLDAQSRAVWIYPPAENGQFDSPLYFFEDEVPHTENAIDMLLYDSDLFILNNDSTFTICSYGRMETIPNRCEEPVVLQDTRPGHGDTPQLPDANLTQITFSPPPNHAMLLLDAPHQRIYRLSLGTRSIQGLFMPAMNDFKPDEAFTALAVSPERVLFVSTGQAIFYAAHIP